MKFLELFPTTVLGGILDKITPNQLDSYKTHLSLIPYKDVGNNDGKISQDQNVLDNPIFSSLKNNIFEYAFKYTSHLNHIVEDLQISNSWSNILNINENIHVHKHSNSYISGVFYLENGGSSIGFKNPSSFGEYGWNPSFSDEGIPDIKFIPPEKGLLLIFPSWLEHFVSTSKLDRRISLAFNIIPKGEFGEPTMKLYL